MRAGWGGGHAEGGPAPIQSLHVVFAKAIKIRVRATRNAMLPNAFISASTDPLRKRFRASTLHISLETALGPSVTSSQPARRGLRLAWLPYWTKPETICHQTGIHLKLAIPLRSPLTSTRLGAATARKRSRFTMVRVLKVPSPAKPCGTRRALVGVQSY